MLYWLAHAASEARKAAGRKQVHVAAAADMDQSSLWRFEQARAWPRDPDEIVSAYADDLDIDPIALWEMALHLWREDQEREPTPLPDVRGQGEAAAQQVVAAMREAAAASGARGSKADGTPRRRREAG